MESALIGYIIFLIVTALRIAGSWEKLELKSLDALLQYQPLDSHEPTPIIAVAFDDQDIRAMDRGVISDRQMAQLLKTLIDMKASVIGLDIYRDQPETDLIDLQETLQQRFKNAPTTQINQDNLYQVLQGESKGLSDLNTLLTDRKIRKTVCVYLHGQVNPPPALKGLAPLIGVADVPFDTDGVCRRPFLYVSDAEGVKQSLSLGIANKYLEDIGVLQFDRNDRSHTGGYWPSRLPRFSGDVGPYVRDDARGYQYFIDFKSPRKYPTFNIRQVIDLPLADKSLPKISQRDVEGKIVLVGNFSGSAKDVLHVPLRIDTKNYTFGSIFHAWTIDYLVRNARYGAAPIHFPRRATEIALFLMISLAGAVIASRFRSLIAFCVLVVVGLALLVGSTVYIFNHTMLVLPIVPAAICWAASTIASTAFMVQREKAAKAVIMNLFGKTVDKKIADALVDRREEILEEGRPRSDLAEVTALFTDLQGFTSKSEGMSPAELIQWLDEYMNKMTKVALDHNGTVMNYIGDAIMVVFGAPLCNNDPQAIRAEAGKAVDCALAMRKRFVELVSGWKLRRPELGDAKMRVGINTGQVVVGSIGNEQRQQYTVLGDPINVASRLESYDKKLMDDDIAAGGCRILVGERTYSLLDGKYQTRSIGSAMLSGKNKSITIYGIIGGGR